MKKHGSQSTTTQNQILIPPAYPLTGIELLGNLVERLSRVLQHRPGFAELAQMMGKSKSTTHFWFSEYRHPQIVSLMTLLEHLPSNERLSFIESSCRILPTLDDIRLTGATGKLEMLLQQDRGISFVTGSTDHARFFFVTSFGHSWSRMRGQRLLVTGTDLHRPRHFVPVIGVRHIDETKPAGRIRDLVLSVWPRILTSNAKLALFNRLLSVIPENTDDLVRMAETKHVVLAESSPSAFCRLTRKTALPVHVLTLAKSEQSKDEIYVSCRTA